MMLNVAESDSKFQVAPVCCWKELEATEGYTMMLNVAESTRKLLVDPDCGWKNLEVAE